MARTIVQSAISGQQVLLCGMLHPEEFHRAVRGGTHDGHQHELSARGSGSVDQVDVALVVDRGRGCPAGSGESVDRRDDDVRPADSGVEAGAVTHVASHYLDAQRGEMACPGRGTSQHPDCKPPAR